MNKPKPRILQIALLVFVFIFTSNSTFAQRAPLKGLDAYVEKAMQDWQVPGIAIGIVKDDALFFARGYGVRELGKKAKVNEHTLFAIASNSKAFTASLLGMLVEEGKLNWDDRVIDYLKTFQMYDPYVTREIRVKDLLTHRSGLATFGGDHLWIGNPLSREEIISRLRYLKPTAPFRTKFQYQNLMFMVAGQLIPAVTGKSWDEFIQERIFTPLGMSESNTSVGKLKDRENIATPHEFISGKLVAIEYDNVDNIAAAGGINSNIVDMSKWMRLNLNSGVFAGEEIISPKIMRELHSIQFPLMVSSFSEKNFGTRFSGYGLGWSISDYKGYKMVSHGGGLSGMISLQTLIPEKNLGILVLSNLAPNSLPRALTYRILDAFLGESPKDWSALYLDRRTKSRERQNKAELERQDKRVKGTQPSLKLTEYTGKYQDELSGTAEVKLEQDKLVFDYNPRHIGDLEHWHYNTFRVTWRHPIFDMAGKSFLTFYLDEMGKVKELKVTFYDPIYFQKLPEAK